MWNKMDKSARFLLLSLFMNWHNWSASNIHISFTVWLDISSPFGFVLPPNISQTSVIFQHNTFISKWFKKTTNINFNCGETLN